MEFARYARRTASPGRGSAAAQGRRYVSRRSTQ